MTDFGIYTGMMQTTLQPIDLARAVEERGFDSLAFGEHSHVPAGVVLPASEVSGEWFASQYDPFVALGAAAAVTTTLRLGTAVTLIPEHHPISMAKAISTLDQISGGRTFFGIGAAWNKEVENHGVPFAERWRVTRDTVLAMRRIWADDPAEYHGKYVDFEPIWCKPKPIQHGGPPILMGANSRWALRRVVDYCDGWMPYAPLSQIRSGMLELRELAERGERSDRPIRVEPLLGEVNEPNGQTIEEACSLGVARIHLKLPHGSAADQWRALDAIAKTIDAFK
ncbi:MAG: LLM class F420-dependent oxidoreductase [Dehalococcoidia bacterium]|uniref:LLM class F420-dependent oxidoreductase n=1 Tax=Candidatus Amarobacter glycogenicus TaxID=3140699 RepID=UPI0031369BE4|nr:LLM class F420-dependent oxidoreductase [Dehalococcoidia bacterium]